MKLITINDAVAELQKYIPQASTYIGDDMTLNRMWPLLEAVGNPQEKLRIIHVAGTSGKTSTSYYISSILSASGKKVGLTVSPHIDSITERIQINNQPLDDKTFCLELGIFLDYVSEISPMPSYFEILIAFMYWEFARQNVEYLIVETGLGGLYDSTNVAVREDKICVITDVGYDHMHILGNTLPEIAAQKAGIIHENNNVFIYEQSSEIINEIIYKSDEKTAELNIYNYNNLFANNSLPITELPEFQKRNFLLSYEVCKYIAKRDGFSIKNDYDPETVIVPARMETIWLSDKSILIMDGSHNGQKMSAFVKSFSVKYPNKKALIMLALKKGKEYMKVIDEIAPITNTIILTTFNTSQDLPALSQNPDKTKDYCDQKNIKSVVIFDHTEAVDYILKQEDSIKIITGSFYLIGQARMRIKEVL